MSSIKLHQIQRPASTLRPIQNELISGIRHREPLGPKRSILKNLTTDVLIVGSGFGGAPPALRLAQAGFKTIVLEKGPSIDPQKDFRQTQDPKYFLKYIKNLSGESLSLTFAEGLGGASPFYEMVSLRAPTQAFQIHDTTENNPIKKSLWSASITREKLDPYYEKAETKLKVIQPPIERIPKTGQIFSLMMKRLGYSSERMRLAIQNCIGSGFCVSGCIYGAKQSLLLNYLPQAVSHGAEIYCDQEVKIIKPIEEGNFRYFVTAENPVSQETLQIKTKILILGAGTLGTALLLLKNKKNFSDWNPHIGKHIAFNGGVASAGILPDDLPDVDNFTGYSIPGVISYEFLNSHGIVVFPAKPLPLQLVASGRYYNHNQKGEKLYWGDPNVEWMKKYRKRIMILYALGFTPPCGEIRLNTNGKIEVLLKNQKHIWNHQDEVKVVLDSILLRNQCSLIQAETIGMEGRPYSKRHATTAHHVGSCRMADSPEQGVVNPQGEMFGYPQLFITDGSAIPSSTAVNPSLTVLANSERITHGILEKFRP